MRRFLRVRSRLSRPDTSRVFTCASGRVKPSVEAFRANDGSRVPLATDPALTDIFAKRAFAGAHAFALAWHLPTGARQAGARAARGGRRGSGKVARRTIGTLPFESTDHAEPTRRRTRAAPATGGGAS